MRPYEEDVAALEPTDPDQLPSEKYRVAKRVLRNHQAQKSIEYEELLDSLSRKHKMDKLKLKGTVILTSVSLMGQWEDEVEKHAPGLTIKTFHSSRKSNPLFVNLSAGHRSGKLRGGKDHTTDPDECNADSMVELSKADVIISSSTIWWPKLVAKGFEFRRVVHDESHLFGGPSAKVEAANYISSQFRWCVTATPLASSFRDLGRQLEFIWGKDRWGAGGAYQGDYNEIERATRAGNDSQEQFDRLVGILGRYLIRHTKSQRIGGEEILALPPSTTSTVMLTMSKDEDKALNKVHTTSKVLNRCLEGGGETFTIERCFGFPLGSILRSDTSDKDYRSLVEVGGKKKSGKIIRRLKFQGLTKIIALRKDLQEQLEKEPNLRAVVFTQVCMYYSRKNKAPL
jgi:SNF2 family DNA or RNA helicase